MSELSPEEQPWALSHRADPASVAIADRHYNRQKVGTPQFVPPGRCVVLRTPGHPALWVTSWPFAEYVRHDWPGAWVNSCFRSEAQDRFLSSDLIRSALAATVAVWREPPSLPVVPPDGEPMDLSLVTFIDRGKTKTKRDPGYCYLKAGFRVVGQTRGGLVAVGIDRRDLPPPLPALGTPEPLPFAPLSSRETAPGSAK